VCLVQGTWCVISVGHTFVSTHCSTEFYPYQENQWKFFPGASQSHKTESCAEYLHLLCSVLQNHIDTNSPLEFSNNVCVVRGRSQGYIYIIMEHTSCRFKAEPLHSFVNKLCMILLQGYLFFSKFNITSCLILPTILYIHML